MRAQRTSLIILLDRLYRLYLSTYFYDIVGKFPPPDNLVQSDLHVLPLNKAQRAWLEAYLALRDET